MFTPGELRALLLVLLSHAPRHGYELAAEIARTTKGGYTPSPGILYPALQALEREGAIAPVGSADRRRRTYEITGSGRERLKQDDLRASRALAKLDAARSDASASGSELIHAALSRLEAALRQHETEALDTAGARIAARIDDLILLMRRELSSPSTNQETT